MSLDNETNSKTPTGVAFDENDETPLHLPDIDDMPAVSIWEIDKWWWVKSTLKLSLVMYFYLIAFFLLTLGILTVDSDKSFLLMQGGVVLIFFATVLSTKIHLGGKYRINKALAANEFTKPLMRSVYPNLDLSGMFKIEDVTAGDIKYMEYDDDEDESELELDADEEWDDEE